MKRKPLQLFVLLSLALFLFSSCKNDLQPQKSMNENPLVLGKEAITRMLANDIDGLYALFLPELFDNSESTIEIRNAYQTITDWLITDCVVDLNSGQFYEIDEHTNEKITIFDISTADIYEYTHNFLSNDCGYTKKIEKLALCSFNITDNGEEDLCAFVMGKLDGLWYIVVIYD